MSCKFEHNVTWTGCDKPAWHEPECVLTKKADKHFWIFSDQILKIEENIIRKKKKNKYSVLQKLSVNKIIFNVAYIYLSARIRQSNCWKKKSTGKKKLYYLFSLSCFLLSLKMQKRKVDNIVPAIQLKICKLANSHRQLSKQQNFQVHSSWTKKENTDLKFSQANKDMIK